MTSERQLSVPLAFRLTQMMSSCGPHTIHAAAKLGIPDVLASGPKPAAEVAKAIDANADAVHRLMRGLVVLELCTMTEEGAFALTPLGEYLRSDVPNSVRGYVLGAGGEEQWKAWQPLAECVRVGRSVAEISGRNMWADASKEDAGIFDHFNKVMAEMTGLFAESIAKAYDFSSFRTIVDIGGGYGTLLVPILKANAGLRGTVFDLPRCRVGQRATAEKHGLADRYDFVGGDFFNDTFPTADAYVLKSVVHDWDDERSIAIMRSIATVMSGGARLLLVEPVVPQRLSSSIADAMIVQSDLQMLLGGGRERTEQEFRALIEKAGLRVARVASTGSLPAIFEAVKPS